MHYRNSRNSSNVRPLCLRMSARVPFASTECIGTTVRKTIPEVRFSKETWLPFCLNSANPARFNARTTRSPETLGSLGTSVRDFDRRPEFLAFYGSFFRSAPGFQIQFDRFAQISTSSLDVSALGSYTQFRASCHEKLVFFGDQNRESVSHKAMLSDAT
jgi:hypothetical protein